MMLGLDDGDELILAKWPTVEDIECKRNNDTPRKNPGVLFNYKIEAKYLFLLRSLAAYLET